MTLRSQMSRQGIRWRYQAGPGGRRRGRLGRWPWALLSLLIVAGVAMAVWKGAFTRQTPASLVAEPLADDASAAQVDYTLPAPDVTQRIPAPHVRQADATPPARPTRPVAPDNVWTLDGGSQTDAPRVDPVVPVAPPTSADRTQTPLPDAPRTSAAEASTTPRTPQAQTSSPAQGDRLAQGLSLIEQGRRIEGRKLLSQLLADGTLTPAQAQKVRDVLTVVNHSLIYSPTVTAGDPLVATHVVKRGDRLVNIAIQYKIPHQFIEKINRIDAHRIQIGQKIKVPNGPFHAVVSKTAYRMDVFLKDPADGQMIYIRSFNVGLGADDSTPLGDWVVRPRSKVQNPAWTNPRTGETFGADDPKNPIGEFWMGLEGVSAQTASLAGYGIHGTIEPDSIGTQSSMGCVRLRDEDIAQVYIMFWEGETTVSIVR